MRGSGMYLTGIAIMYALVFAFPFASRFLSVSIWPFFVAALVVAVPLQWGWTRATGIKMGFRNLSYPGPGRPARYAVVVVSLGAIVTEHFLIDRGLIVAAIAVAAPRGRGGGGPPAGPSAGDPPGAAKRRGGVTAKPDPLIHPITRLSICGLLAAGADWVEFRRAA